MQGKCKSQGRSQLRFLDIELVMFFLHICWTYKLTTPAGMLLYDSTHSKLVKHGIVGIVVLCLNAALTKLCLHKINDNFECQAHRFEVSEYARGLIASAAKTLPKGIKKPKVVDKKQQRSRTIVVVP